MNDTLSILEKECAGDASVAAPLHGLRRLLLGAGEGHELIAYLRMANSPMAKLEESQHWHATAGGERAYWVARLSSEFNSWIESADRYLSWMETLALPPDAIVRSIGNGSSDADTKDLW